MTLQPAKQNDGAPLTDEALMLRVLAAGEGAPFNELVRRHGAFAYRVAVAKCGRRELAEEVVQEAFLRIARGRCTFEDQGEGSFRAWFYHYVMNHAREADRSERRISMRTQSAEYRERSRARAEADRGRAGDEADSEAVRAALCELSEELRLPLILHFIQDLPQVEVSRLLKISQPQISRRIAEGLELLRRRLSTRGSALSIVAVPGLLRMEGLLNAPPELLQTLNGLQAASLARAGQEASRRLAPAAPSTGLAVLGLVCCASVACAAAWWFARDPSSSTVPATGVVPAAPAASVEPQARSLGAWDFSKGALPDLRVLQSSWAWRSDLLGGAMLAPKGSDVLFQFPVAMPRQAIHIQVEGCIYETGVASVDIFWTRGEVLHLPQQYWLQVKSFRPTRSREVFRYDLYLFGRYAVCLVDGTPSSVRRFEAELPGDMLCMLVENMVVKNIEIFAIPDSGIPEALKDPEKIAAKMKPVSRHGSKTTMTFDEITRASVAP